jgi:hypothetical protein
MVAMARPIKPQQPFSQELQHWLKTSRDKSLIGLIKVFEEKAFAIIFLILMALPALPIPTGGVTHVTEVVTALGALQLIAGRRIIWLPGWASRKVNVGKLMGGKAGQKLISVIKWFERLSRRRWSGLLVMRPVLSLLGLFVLAYTAAAFVAPPFSGLDTLPALGVVVISLGLILEDSLIVLTGIVVGAAGITLDAFLADTIIKGFQHLF